MQRPISRRIRWGTQAMRAVLVLLIVSGTVWNIESKFNEAENLGTQQIQLETLHVNRQIHIVLEGARQTLDMIAAQVERSITEDAAIHRIDTALNATIDRALLRNPVVLGAIVQNSDGVVVFAGGSRGGIGRNLGSLDYFKRLKEPDASSYVLGAPFESPVFGTTLIPLARTIYDSDGIQAGVVAVGVPLGVIQQALAPRLAAFDAKARLWRDDGLLLASSVTDNVKIGEFYRSIPLFKERDPALESGSFVALSPLNNEVRISGWRNNAAYPVFVSAGANRGPLLEEARLHGYLAAGAAALALLLLATTSYLVERENRMRLRLIGELETSVERAQNATREFERANRSKTKLLANLSHELRTPLNAVIGFAEMVRLGYKGAVSDGAKESLDLVLRSAKHLDGLVAALLDLSRVELDPAALEIAEADAKAALGDAIAIVREAADRKSLAVACDLPGEPLRGQFDRMRFVQVAVNLLSNAVRHSPTGGTIDVLLRCRDGMIELCVADRGPGVTAEQLETMLEPFGDPNLAAVRPVGTGLGLSISREIARAHGGDLVVANRAEGGLRACARFAERGPAGAMPPQPALGFANAQR
jgi:signal transduction histidine kinase